ncbi:MAG: MASE1 domain-containing protein [Arenimonas sp.]
MSHTMTRTEAASGKRLESLPAMAWPLMSLVYAAIWLGLLQPSQVLWFLPAGLRLAALWVLPAKRWHWVLVGEALVAAFLDWSTDDSLLNLNFIALSFAPLMVYAAALYLIRGAAPGSVLNTPRSMLTLLTSGGLSALAVSPILSFFYQGDSFAEIGFDPGTWGSIFSFVYGDLIGQLSLAPVLILLFHQSKPGLRELGLWRAVFIATVATSMVLSLLHFRQALAPFLLLLVFAPMFVVAFRRGWKGAVLSVSMTALLLEGYLHFNPLPLDLIILQLAFALIAAGSLMLGAAMSALRDSHFSLQRQHEHMALVNAELLDTSSELRQVSQRLVRIEEQGQRELADELDVELGQSLHTLGTHLSLAVRSVKEQETLKILSSIREKTREMEDSLRRVLRQLRPKALDNKGLKDALVHGPLHEVLDDAGINLETEFVGSLNELHEDEKTAIYRICQTITRQAIGMKGVKQLKIEVQVNNDAATDHEVLLTIAIDPIEPEQMEKHRIPLTAVQDRVLALYGDYVVQSQGQSLLHRIVFQQKVQ